MLSVNNLGISFGGIRAVDDVSFDVRRGEIFSIVGPNGAGKTTVFNLVSRIIDCDSGTVRFDEVDLMKLPLHDVASTGLVRTFQNLELLPTASLLENVLLGSHVRTPGSLFGEMFATARSRAAEQEAAHRARRAVEFLGLAQYTDVVVANLPYGVRKIAEVARALAAEPRMLLLDEPTAGLNSAEKATIGQRILDIRGRLGVTVLLIEHDMRFVRQVTDRMLAMNVGRVIAQGSPAEVLGHSEELSAYLGEPA
jgi:branched-chain amino acid transport system ATP-binding protein